MKYQKVYSSKIAGELCRRGYRVRATKPNPKKPWLNMFLFEVTDSFKEEFSDLINKTSEGTKNVNE